MSEAVGKSESLSEARELKGLRRSERIEKLFGVEPTGYQAEMLDYGESQRRAQVAPKAGRQVGKTWTAGMVGADHALTHADTDVLFTAPGQGTANEMFRECKRLFWGSELDLDTFGVVEDNKETWEFTNGTRILSRTLGNVERENNSGNRGMNPSCVIVDEAAYSRDEVFTEVIEEFFITHEEYEYYLFSTPAGKSGYFYKKVSGGYRDLENALEDEWGWFSPYLPTRKSPFAQQDFIERKREELDSQTFAQEFLGEFQSAADSYLPHDVVDPCIQPDVERNGRLPRYLGVDPAEKGDDRLVIIDLDSQGNWWNIWSRETVTGPDFVGLLSDLQGGGTAPPPEVGVGSTPSGGYQEIVVESNIAGLATDIAQKGLGSVVTPVKSSLKSKAVMYKRLKRDMEARDIAIPNHRALINQTTRLEYSYTVNNNLKIQHPPNGHDDYCFVGDTPILTPRGNVPIDELSVGDLVVTRDGPKPIVATGEREAEVISRFGLTGTPDHPVVTREGVRRFDSVKASELIYTWNVKPSCITATDTIDTRNQATGTSANTIGDTQGRMTGLSHSTASNGGTHTEKYQGGTLSITKTETAPTTTLRTWSASVSPNTNRSISVKNNERSSPSWSKKTLNRKRRNGTHRRKVGNGINSTTRTLRTNSTRNDTHTNAGFVEMNTDQISKKERSTVRTAEMKPRDRDAPKQEFVSGVGKNTKQIGTRKERIARSHAPCSTTTATVHNITVAGAHEYFAGNILVHNCDALMLANAARTGLSREFSGDLGKYGVKPNAVITW